MPEQLRKMVLGGLTREWLLGCVVAVAAFPALAADPLPASVRACSAVTDSLQRLVCYDREVAKYPASGVNSGATSAPTAQQGTGGQPAAGASGAGAVVGGTGAPAGSASMPSAAAGAPGTNSSASGDTGAASAKTDYDPITAHIVSIDRHPNEMVLHLDNGQVWQQIQATSGDLSLHAGDEVKIDRHFGSWWLNGPHVSSMKVQRKT